MHTLRFSLAWGFIFLAAVYDSCFAWFYRADLVAWEQNPFARWGVASVGLPGVFFFKFVGLAFAASVAFYCHRRCLGAGRVLTLVLTSAYLMLATHYYLGQQERPEARLSHLSRVPGHFGRQ